MIKVAQRTLVCIPPTPLVGIVLPPDDFPVWCKLEFLNTSGSTKDRIARFILGKAYRKGILRTDSVVVEASSGSTSIAMSMVCAQLGLRFLAPSLQNNQKIQGFSNSLTNLTFDIEDDQLVIKDLVPAMSMAPITYRLMVEKGKSQLTIRKTVIHQRNFTFTSSTLPLNRNWKYPTS
ncbi:MAG: pyridoxal-phosphate dependent enzyme [Zavarzinella sp.]